MDKSFIFEKKDDNDDFLFEDKGSESGGGANQDNNLAGLEESGKTVVEEAVPVGNAVLPNTADFEGNTEALSDVSDSVLENTPDNVLATSDVMVDDGSKELFADSESDGALNGNGLSNADISMDDILPNDSQPNLVQQDGDIASQFLDGDSLGDNSSDSIADQLLGATEPLQEDAVTVQPNIVESLSETVTVQVAVNEPLNETAIAQSVASKPLKAVAIEPVVNEPLNDIATTPSAINEPLEEVVMEQSAVADASSEVMDDQLVAVDTSNNIMVEQPVVDNAAVISEAVENVGAGDVNLDNNLQGLSEEQPTNNIATVENVSVESDGGTGLNGDIDGQATVSAVEEVEALKLEEVVAMQEVVDKNSAELPVKEVEKTATVESGNQEVLEAEPEMSGVSAEGTSKASEENLNGDSQNLSEGVSGGSENGEAIEETAENVEKDVVSAVGGDTDSVHSFKLSDEILNDLEAVNDDFAAEIQAEKEKEAEEVRKKLGQEEETETEVELKPMEAEEKLSDIMNLSLDNIEEFLKNNGKNYCEMSEKEAALAEIKAKEDAKKEAEKEEEPANNQDFEVSSILDEFELDKELWDELEFSDEVKDRVKKRVKIEIKSFIKENLIPFLEKIIK